YDHLPLGGVALRRMLVAGEHADQRSAQVTRYACQRSDVLDLHFAVRNLAVIEVGGEVVVTGDDNGGELSALEPRAQSRAGGCVVIEHREMGTLRHQHDAFVAEAGGMVEELVEREKRLSPEAGVADRMQKRW